jgi:hypothetical protein
MTFYILIFTLFSVFALIGRARYLPHPNLSYQDNSMDFLWFCILIFLTLMIGFRYGIGGDWNAYLNYSNFMTSVKSISTHISIIDDPAYTFLNWFSGRIGAGIYGVNLFCGLLFSYGIIKLCRSLPRPFLALVAAFPYLVIVVSMGYSRQAAALGIALIAITKLVRFRIIQFSILIFLAAMFHKTALIILGLILITFSGKKIKALFLASIFFIPIYFLVLQDAIAELFLYYYVDNAYESKGALIRLFMIFFPSIILILWPSRFPMNPVEMNVWKVMAYASIFLFLAFFFVDASTAIDRIALYLLPIQLVVFSYLPEFFGKHGEQRQWILISIILLYFIIMIVWLSFSPFSYTWMPYKSILFLSHL